MAGVVKLRDDLKVRSGVFSCISFLPFRFRRTSVLRGTFPDCSARHIHRLAVSQTGRNKNYSVGGVSTVSLLDSIHRKQLF